jgi:hypothetical protein
MATTITVQENSTQEARNNAIRPFQIPVVP